jgi:hypothetical protein
VEVWFLGERLSPRTAENETPMKKFDLSPERCLQLSDMEGNHDVGAVAPELLMSGSERRPCSPVGWKSIAWWPDTVSLLNEENTSEDKHHSEEAADAVCRALLREGLGGERQIFPLRTKVEPIFPENVKILPAGTEAGKARWARSGG